MACRPAPQNRPLHMHATPRHAAAGLQRQVLFGGLRIGMYDPVKALFVGKDHVGEVPLHTKIAAGLTTGALGIAIANPTDLVKVRMQAEGKLKPGQAKRYPGALAAYGIIARTEGLAALWTGVGPNMARNAIINAAELASYDQIKETLLATGAPGCCWRGVQSEKGWGEARARAGR